MRLLTLVFGAALVAAAYALNPYVCPEPPTTGFGGDYCCPYFQHSMFEVGLFCCSCPVCLCIFAPPQSARSFLSLLFLLSISARKSADMLVSHPSAERQVLRANPPLPRRCGESRKPQRWREKKRKKRMEKKTKTNGFETESGVVSAHPSVFSIRLRITGARHARARVFFFYFFPHFFPPSPPSCFFSFFSLLFRRGGLRGRSL
jgi:hypothetical protein